MKTIRGAAAALLISTLALTACTGTPALEVTTNAPAAEATPTPTPSPTPTVAADAERGTRANPLAVGESRKISELSMWTVGADAATITKNGYIVLPIRLGMDWEATRQQYRDAGEDPAALDNEGVDPSTSLFVTFVTAGGKTYRDWSSVDSDNDDPQPWLWGVGALYPPAETTTAFFPITVPTEEIPGGVWRVENSAGETIFLAQQ
jgi:hypothetical protein